jgi:hypothetical protein
MAIHRCRTLLSLRDKYLPLDCRILASQTEHRLAGLVISDGPINGDQVNYA